MKKYYIIIILLIFSTEIMSKDLETATLGGGCFWCTEAVYKELKGVVEIKPGYSGGEIKNPTYKEVCTGRTGHAEVVQITFDPEIVSFSEILEVFFLTHDPTTLNRQGNDVGTQYRSAIFYHSESQKHHFYTRHQRFQVLLASSSVPSGKMSLFAAVSDCCTVVSL